VVSALMNIDQIAFSLNKNTVKRTIVDTQRILKKKRSRLYKPYVKNNVLFGFNKEKPLGVTHYQYSISSTNRDVNAGRSKPFKTIQLFRWKRNQF
jgi:hypothetical protein